MEVLIPCKVLRENASTGMKTVAVPADGWVVVHKWLTGQGLDPLRAVRGYRVTSKGLVTFRCGVGYAIFDDLLGGNGSGNAERRFRDDTGHYLTMR